MSLRRFIFDVMFEISNLYRCSGITHAFWYLVLEKTMEIKSNLNYRGFPIIIRKEITLFTQERKHAIFYYIYYEKNSAMVTSNMI